MVGIIDYNDQLLSSSRSLEFYYLVEEAIPNHIQVLQLGRKRSRSAMTAQTVENAVAVPSTEYMLAKYLFISDLQYSYPTL